MRGRTDRGSVSTGAKRSAIVTGEELTGVAADVAAPHVAGGPDMMTMQARDVLVLWSWGRRADLCEDSLHCSPKPNVTFHTRLGLMVVGLSTLLGLIYRSC